MFGDLNRPNPPYWTLEVEVQFYIVAPLLAAVFLLRDRLSRRFLIGAAAVSATLIQAGYGDRLAPRARVRDPSEFHPVVPDRSS